MEGAHINTRPHTDTITHTSTKEDTPIGAARHTSTRIYTESRQDATGQTKQILAQTETNAHTLHTPTCTHQHLAGVEIYTRLEGRASANK